MMQRQNRSRKLNTISQLGAYQRGAYMIALRFFIPLLLLVACIGLLVFLRWDSARNAHEDAERDAQFRLNHLGADMQDELQYYLREEAWSRVQARFSKLSSSPEIEWGILVDGEGKILAATQMGWIGNQFTDWIRRPHSSEGVARLLESAQIQQGGTRTAVVADRPAVLALFPVQMDIRGAHLRPSEVGKLILLQDLTFSLLERQTINKKWLARVALLMAGLTMGIGLVLHFLVSRRIGKLVQAAKRVSAGDLRVRVDMAGTDELAGLANTFNAMVGSLAQSSQQVRKLLRAVEQAPVSVIITNPEAVIEYVNPHFSVATGYTREETLGQPVSFLKSGMMRSEEYSKMWQVIKSGETWYGEIQNRRKDGTLFWEQASIAPVRDETGTMTHFISVQEDITKRKRDEDNLKLFGRVFENVNEAIMVTDADRNIIFTNAAFTRITGYASVEVAGKNPRMLSSGVMDATFYRDMWRSIHETGQWQGEIMDQRKSGENYIEWLSASSLRDVHGEISHYIGVFSDISERKAVEQRMAYMAEHDVLTDLPNRVLLFDRLSQAVSRAEREQHIIAIMFLDLDNFKATNDTLGHQAGDLLLKEVASRIRSVARTSDTISRQGGDEFVVMMPGLEDTDDAAVIAGKLLESIAGPCQVNGIEIDITTSIGISVFPADGRDADTLLKHADAAMYHAKKKGRNNFQFYTSEMNRHAVERMSIEHKLRHALERNELYLDYQPQVDIRSGKIIGAEALLRWKNPDLGLVPPGKFIPIAEDNGLIVSIGEWVLRAACKQNMAWRKAGLPPITMAVNLSAVQFRQKNLLDIASATLKESGLDAPGLELEITESALIHDTDAAITLLHRLKNLGVMLAMDDFGVGYSSLNYLKRFPIDKLKIDQSFVRDLTMDPDDAAIVTTIISMAHNLDLNVIAEGVETAEQLAFLQQHHCDEMQGYFYSRPVRPEAFATLLTSA